jgi:hypothetical protein
MLRKDFIIKDGDKEILLSVKSPSYEEIEEADKVYSGKVASLVRESGKKKLLLRQEIDNFLRSANIWTKVDEDTVSKLQKEIDTLLNKLRRGGIKLSEGRTVCIEIMDKRKEIVGIMRKRQVFDDTTIESLAESERNDYLVYTSTVYADSGEHYWESFDDMKNDKLSEAYSKASTIVIELVYGINNEFEKRLPENRWLKKFDFVDDDLNYIDRKTKAKVDKDGNLLEDSATVAKRYVENLQGEIQAEQPYIDDETGDPVGNSETADV